MQTKTLSPEALAVIDQFLHFKVGNAVTSIPYFNNKTVRARATLRVMIGKGSPKEIHEEIRAFTIKHHIDLTTLADESLKKLLIDQGVGIDCSGFTYHVLEAEGIKRGLGKLNRHLSFVHSHGPMRKMISYLRPIENCDVSTISSERNSRVIKLDELEPGDFISMLSGTEDIDRDHILLIHAVDSDGTKVSKIYYSHAIAYSTDGVYGNGIKQGSITITNPDGNITDQTWIEGELTSSPNVIHAAAKAAKTELRRLKWF